MRSDVVNSDSHSASGPALKIKRVPGKCEQRVRNFVFSKRGAKILSWSFTSLLCLTLALTSTSSSDQVTYILSSLAVSLSVTITIFVEYAFYEHFPISAVLNIGTTLVLSFF